MTNVVVLTLGTALLLIGLYFFVTVIRSKLKFGGKMLVTCPETQEAVGVKVDGKSATLSMLPGQTGLHLSECTRWPERQDCGQTCLAQIENSPDACMVRNVLADWYRNKACVYCRNPFGESHWHDHKPAVRNADGDIVEWADIPVETLPQVLETHSPVCWNCLVAENFRKQHPDLVTDRPVHHH